VRSAARSDERYTDQTIACADCGADFVWTAGEQQYFAEHELLNRPKRCKSCRAKKRPYNREAQQRYRHQLIYRGDDGKR